MAMPRKSINKITVLLSEEEFERFDIYCRDRGYKKSTLIARLIRQYLDLEGFARETSSSRFRGPSLRRD
jgi:metal-responsive CopG/Arc/MetJ family transcriptional regulator